MLQGEAFDEVFPLPVGEYPSRRQRAFEQAAAAGAKKAHFGLGYASLYACKNGERVAHLHFTFTAQNGRPAIVTPWIGTSVMQEGLEEIALESCAESPYALRASEAPLALAALAEGLVALARQVAAPRCRSIVTADVQALRRLLPGSFWATRLRKADKAAEELAEVCASAPQLIADEYFVLPGSFVLAVTDDEDRFVGALELERAREDETWAVDWVNWRDATY